MTAANTGRRSIAALAAVLAYLAVPIPSHAQGAALQPPMFSVDARWPTLPEGTVLGEVTSIAIGPDDHVYVLHRPRSVPEDARAHAAPPVLELDADGRLVRSWGGPSDVYDWPEREHGIWVDAEGYVWISGNGGWPRPAEGGSTDDMILKFARDGELVMQIGRRGASLGNADTVNLHQPADLFVHEATDELYVADGYGNRRVIVFDASTGEYKRHWGAFGNEPTDEDDTDAHGADAASSGTPPQFNLVHAVKVSDDGMVYVADRGNRRVQWFTTEGEFISDLVIEGDATPAPAGFAFSPDPAQRFLYVVESANARVLIYERASMRQVGVFGSRSAAPGGMDIAHHIAVDSKGNLYTAEIVNNRRAQKFVATTSSGR